MSQIPQYICDGYNKPTGEKAHLSLVLQSNMTCGVALPPNSPGNKDPRWKVVRNPNSGNNFLHFHSGKCIALWADKEITKAKGRESKK